MTGISPASGPLAGGTAVTITGTNLAGATAVKFGTTEVTTFTSDTDTQIVLNSPAGTGTVDVMVVTPGGTSPVNQPADQFSYVAAPAVTGISPASGPLAGGTAVTITGTNLAGATAVKFGTTEVTTFTSDTDTQIVLNSPGGTGTVDVMVVTPGGTSPVNQPADQFSYVAAPAVTGISPASGPLAGGTAVTITGTNLAGATAVKFGTTEVTTFTSDTDTQIVLNSPGGTGTVDVMVVTPGGTSLVNQPADQFSYVAAPAVTGISPASGPLAGGTAVTITGTNLAGATAVKFGTTEVTTFTSDTDTQIVLNSPGGTGTVDVMVVTPGGTSPVNQPADQFSYVAAPAVTGISPASGPLAGGTAVTITGTNLAGATAVKFGTTEVTTFTSDTDTQIVLNSPGGTGTVDVMVVTPGGTSPVNQPADQFSYVAAPAVMSINDVSLSEGNSGTTTFTFTVSMSGSNTLGASVSYATADGTATAGDYWSANGTLTWAPGDTSSKTISVTVNGDRTVEPDETFYVNLSSPTNATLSKSQGVGTIQNDDVQSSSTLPDTIGLFAPTTSKVYLRDTNDSGYADLTFNYGAANAGWLPIAGDWDGNGTVTIGMYNPKTSVFSLRNTNNSGPADLTFEYGQPGAGWLPIAGDWDGNGTDTIGLYNPATSKFFLRNTNDSGYADLHFAYGTPDAGWLPIAGDWSGDGTDTIGLYNPTKSKFFLRNTNDTGYADRAFQYGQPGLPAGSQWTPIAGDWNGDGTGSIGLYNPATSKFFLRNTNDSGYADLHFAYGTPNAGWLPIAGDWTGPTNACLAAGGAVTPSANVPILTQADLQPIISEAITRWTNAGLDATAAAKLTQAQFRISNLPGSYLGETEGDKIYIDSNAAGYGWFVDPTPTRDEEFAATSAKQRLKAIDPRAVDRIDLLTVVEHELGHILGLKDLNTSTDDLMSGVLGVGVRRDLSHQDAVDAALAS